MNVEALTAIKMVNNQIYPAAIGYLNKISNTANSLKLVNIDNNYLLEDISELSELIKNMKASINELENAVINMKGIKDFKERAVYIKDNIIKVMNSLRKIVDEVESKVDFKDWPIPTYVDLLFSI